MPFFKPIRTSHKQCVRCFLVFLTLHERSNHNHINSFIVYSCAGVHCFVRLVLVFVFEGAARLPRFLLVLCEVCECARVQMNAHSGAIPKSLSSSESQLHRGACLGICLICILRLLPDAEGINLNGETRCLMSVMICDDVCINAY